MNANRPALAAGLLLLLVAASCAAPPTTQAPTAATGTTPPDGSVAASLPPLPPATAFVPAVTNPYYPLPQGAKWVYQGIKDGEPTTDTIEVTDGKKEILGIRATVVRDTLTSQGRVVEATEDWFAQDDRGNVWYLGEDTKSFNPDGSVESTEGSWQAGENGARPGIFMPAQPEVGQSFKQESFEGQAEDQFTVVSMSATATVPLGSFKGAMKTRETTPLEPDVVTEKVYVSGIGLVVENDVSGPAEYNRLVTFTPK